MNSIVVLFNGKYVPIEEYIRLIKKSNKSTIKKSNKSLNVLNNLPQDVWENVLMNLPPIKIIEHCNEFPEVDKYCKLHNIIEKRKMKGFPRPSGHCAAFDASTESQNYDLDYLKGNKLAVALNKILIKLYKNNANLVFGDLICTTGFGGYRNDGIYIFDGIKIIELDREIDDYGALPSIFTIITTGAPVEYWCRDDYRGGSDHIIKWSGNESQGIAHNSYVWLNLVDIRDQCINNVALESEENKVITTFKYDDIVYTLYLISCTAYGDIRKTNINFFKKILTKIEILLLEYEEDYDEKTNNILFYNHFD